MTELEQDDFDAAARELCPDGSCTGLLGPDGRCKLCGRAREAADFLAERPVRRGADDDGDGDDGDGGDAGQAAAAPSDDEAAGDFDDRQLCPDGACTGLIGADGRCKACGRAPEGS
jgi:hypothetical protein